MDTVYYHCCYFAYPEEQFGREGYEENMSWVSRITFYLPVGSQKGMTIIRSPVEDFQK